METLLPGARFIARSGRSTRSTRKIFSTDIAPPMKYQYQLNWAIWAIWLYQLNNERNSSFLYKLAISLGKKIVICLPSVPAAFMKIEIKDTATTTISSTFAGSLKQDNI